MESTGMRIRETGSFLNARSIIGRDEDKKRIVDLLLGASVDQGQIPVISVVGIGGIGKTTVARLVYEDESQLGSCRFDLKLWVSDSQKFDLKLLLQKILKSISPDDTSLHNLGIDQVRNRLSRYIVGKKYLLVLDDVKNESCGNWERLEELLKLGVKGSRILVTTRSRRVANVMSSDSMTYELKCLSEEDSWLLFEEMAFKGRKDEKLVQIGKSMVQKCGRVPLAIKTIACLLHGQDQCKWEHIRDNGVGKIKDGHNDMIHILKLSYDDLDTQLKECFQYFALFPKSCPISKEILINIWMSNISIKANRGQHLEDVCEEIIKTLYDRCFIEEIEKLKADVDDDDTYFKMHDLMHDLAKEVAGEEMVVVDSDVMVDSGKLILGENTRHLNLKSTIQTVERISTFETKGRRLRTVLHHDIFTWRNPWEKLLSVDKLMSDFQALRMLDLQKSRFDSLPDTIGRLIHLRYLNLSHNEFSTLPGSISELWSLQSLLLKSCTNLKELPVSIRKLVNLRHLNLEGCNALTRMPSGLGAVKCLRTLNMFIVGPFESEHTAKLEDLEPLSELQGDLIIKLPEKSTLKEPGSDGVFLLSKERLRTLKIEWPDSRYDLANEDLGNDMSILMKLQPNSDLEKYTLYGYEGLRFPPWADNFASLLPNLVSIILDTSRRCQHLPPLSRLQHLKHLTICNLSSLEYIEENVLVDATGFFPSLEYLWLMGLPELKGWCREFAGAEQFSLLPSFPHLSSLHIYGCPNLMMTSFPTSHVRVYSLKGDEDDIFIVEAREALPSQWIMFPPDEEYSVASSMSFSGKFHTNDLRLYLSTPWDQCVDGNTLSLLIKDFNVFTSASIVEAFRRMSKCLTSLEIRRIPGWKSMPKVLQYLTALQVLCIVSCDDFTCEEYDEDLDQPCEGFESLRKLSLYELPNMVRLPKEIQCITSLQMLEIYHCVNLKGLSMDIRQLTNLRYLKVELCNDLTATSIFTSLSQFQSLKYLSLSGMPWLEYIEDDDSGSAALSLPSLEYILLADLPNLKDWCKEQNLLRSFPRLSLIEIRGCQNFNGKSNLLSSVTVFVYDRVWIRVSVCDLVCIRDLLRSSSSNGSLSCKLCIEDPLLFKTAILQQCLRRNSFSVVIGDYDIEPTLEMLDLSRVSSCLTSLQFKGCRLLKTLPRGLEHLFGLQKLSFKRCGEFSSEEGKKGEDEMQWGDFKSLTHLEFCDLPKMEKLPEDIRFISSLQELQISGCNKLVIPEWIHTIFDDATLSEQEGFRFMRKR